MFLAVAGHAKLADIWMMRGARIGLSLTATACGWLFASLWFAGYAWLVWGQMHDVDVVVIWTIPFTLLGWLVLFLPLVLSLSSDNGVFRLLPFTLLGTTLGLVGFMVLVGWWLPLWGESHVYVADPAVTGAVAAAVYSLMARRLLPRKNG